MSESNQKAYDVARLGFVHVTKVDDAFRPIEATVPAQHGEFATVRLGRKGSNIKVLSCVHQAMGGGDPRPCEAHSKGCPCYHAKAVIVWGALVKDVSAILCSDEASATALVTGKDGARVACLWVNQTGGVQWVAYLPEVKDAEAIRKAQEVAHLTQAMQPLLDALQAQAKPAPKATAKAKAS